MGASMSNVSNRDGVILALQRELVGPDPAGDPVALDGVQPLTIDNPRQARRQLNGQEILVQDRPAKRYGVGVLYPAPSAAALTVAVEELESGDREGIVPTPSEAIASEASAEIENLAERGPRSGGPREASDDLDLTGANAFRPTAMAVTFRVNMIVPFTLRIHCDGGSYRAVKVVGTGAMSNRTPAGDGANPETPVESPATPRALTWWARQEWTASTQMTQAELRVQSRRRLRPTLQTIGLAQHRLEVDVVARPEHSGTALITVAVVNRTAFPEGDVDPACLFQVSMKIAATDENGIGAIVPHHEHVDSHPDPEEEELRLLYRRRQTFAIGHGCAADWSDPEQERVGEVRAVSLPIVEIPNTTPDIRDAAGRSITVSMLDLASADMWENASRSLGEVVEAYASWISEREAEIAGVPEQLREAARRNIQECRDAHARMSRGLALVRERAEVRHVFHAMNKAMLIQQIRTAGKGVRRVSGGAVEGDYLADDVTSPPAGKGSWRAFQIAFILMNLSAFDDCTSPERSIVDLIWFPTGGGKTEAYLAVAAFHMLLERLRSNAHRTPPAGTAVLMRYTLRLLTAQQFQRAASLICALEYLRRGDQRTWGDVPFTIGIWVGMTPNTRREATESLARVTRGEEPTKTIIVLERCPWCRAALGPERAATVAAPPRRGGRRGRTQVAVHGYRREGDTVVAYCPDHRCIFSSRLPVAFVDEDMYEQPPTFLIGTVDKFAILAWRPEARSLFGRDHAGQQVRPPPGLIIQDEFHLISGPLGSMVGLYELAIEELCTDRRGDTPVLPKLITSTATVRRFLQQARALCSAAKMFACSLHRRSTQRNRSSPGWIAIRGASSTSG